MRHLRSVIAGLAIVVAASATAAHAQTPGSPTAVPSEDEISRSLAPSTRGSPLGQSRGLPVMGAPPAPANPAIQSTTVPAADAGAQPSAAAAETRPSVTLHTIQFEFGSARLTPDSVATLKNLGNALNHALKDQQHFVIEGHTDARGSASYNNELSRQRAQAVLDYLVRAMGVADTRLQAVGKGFSEPVAGVSPYSAVNRRVVIINLAG